MGWVFTMRPGSGMVIENSVPSGVRHRLAGHAQTARAAEVHAGGRHQGPYRHQAMHLLCIAGLGGRPQVSVLMAEFEGLPLGLSLNGPQGADMQLLRLARRLMPEAAV